MKNICKFKKLFTMKKIFFIACIGGDSFPGFVKNSHTSDEFAYLLSLQLEFNQRPKIAELIGKLKGNLISEKDWQDFTMNMLMLHEYIQEIPSNSSEVFQKIKKIVSEKYTAQTMVQILVRRGNAQEEYNIIKDVHELQRLANIIEKAQA